MNLEALRAALVVAARRHPPSDLVPYRFEKRVMSAIRSVSRDPVADWAEGLRRAAAAFAIVALVSSAGTLAVHTPDDSFNPGAALEEQDAAVGPEDAAEGVADAAIPW